MPEKRKVSLNPFKQLGQMISPSVEAKPASPEAEMEDLKKAIQTRPGASLRGPRKDIVLPASGVQRKSPK